MVGLKKDVLALYQKDMYKAFWEGNKEKPAVWRDIFKVVNKGITGGGDKKTQMLGLGDLDRVLAERQPIKFEAPKQGWVYYIKYHTFQKGLGLSKDQVEDTVKLGNLLKDCARTWGRSVRIKQEEFAADFFNHGPDLSGYYVFNGTHTANTDPKGDKAYDGYPFFNLTGNPRASKGGVATYYNALPNAMSVGNLELLYILHAVTNAKDELDRDIENIPDSLIVKPGALEFTADRILNTERGYPGQNINDKNPFYKKLKQIIAWHKISDANGYYMAEAQTDALEWHERQEPELRFFRDEMTLDYNASINVRWGAWLTNWRKFSCSNLTHA